MSKTDDKTIDLANMKPKTSAEQAAADLDNLIKSQALEVVGSVGKVNFLNLPKDVDYSVGGRLHVRWVHNTSRNIDRRRAEGYMFPEEVSSALPNLTRGANVLMVCRIESKQQKDATLRQMAQARLGDGAKRVRSEKHLDNLEFRPA